MTAPRAPSPPDSLLGSWEELQACEAGVEGPARTHSSLLQGELESILLEAQLESERGSRTDSPPQVLSPRNRASPRTESEPGNSTEHPTVQSEEWQCPNTDVDRSGSSQWVWDWASRPENLPPKEFLFQHPKQTGSLSERKRSFFSSDLLFLFIPSILASHLLTLGLGIYIGKRLAASSAGAL
ncbi:BCL2/adenovirus E1B 19 kDa protein-interacting protein 3 [Lepisosteus oculatus]|uniref:Zgc:73226 n=1 Tax=Lepisosteus oculatus TaxID=7918 RepID=W5LYI9_LEPOC|nr:PREDICTED: BCL2/adenovirus E1B 19 kDa protein-interacting protein 3-like [Lepisosteus oculatus]